MDIRKIIVWLMIIGGLTLITASPHFILEHCEWSGFILAVGIITYVYGVLINAELR